MPTKYRELLNPLLDEYEGFTNDVIKDTNGNPTIGTGLNLNDKNNRGIMALHGVNPDDLLSGKAQLSKEQSDAIRDTILGQKEKVLRSTIGSEFFDGLPDNKKASLASLMYNSRNLIGPNLRQHLANNDDYATGKEILLNSNGKKDLGTLRRRTAEAEMYMGPEQFNKLQVLMSDDDRANIQKILDSSDNENVKQEYLKKYSNLLQKPNAPQPLAFNGLFDSK